MESSAAAPWWRHSPRRWAVRGAGREEGGCAREGALGDGGRASERQADPPRGGWGPGVNDGVLPRQRPHAARLFRGGLQEPRRRLSVGATAVMAHRYSTAPASASIKQWRHSRLMLSRISRRSARLAPPLTTLPRSKSIFPTHPLSAASPTTSPALARSELRTSASSAVRSRGSRDGPRRALLAVALST